MRSYASFSQAVDEAFNARIYGGMHFRSACREGRVLGMQIGGFVLAKVAQAAHGESEGQLSHDHPRDEIRAA